MGDGHLSSRFVAEPVMQPTCDHERTIHRFLGFAPEEVYHAPFVTERPVGSYSTFSPLPDPIRRSEPERNGGIFSVALSVTHIGAPGCYPASCSLEPGLSSLVFQSGRPTRLHENYRLIPRPNQYPPDPPNYPHRHRGRIPEPRRSLQKTECGYNTGKI